VSLNETSNVGGKYEYVKVPVFQGVTNTEIIGYTKPTNGLEIDLAGGLWMLETEA
jgi:hypothetical protein